MSELSALKSDISRSKSTFKGAANNIKRESRHVKHSGAKSNLGSAAGTAESRARQLQQYEKQIDALIKKNWKKQDNHPYHHIEQQDSFSYQANSVPGGYGLITKIPFHSKGSANSGKSDENEKKFFAINPDGNKHKRKLHAEKSRINSNSRICPGHLIGYTLYHYEGTPRGTAYRCSFCGREAGSAAKDGDPCNTKINY